MNCGQANRLLPLWIGRDLADASESEALRAHLEECSKCAERRWRLQESLEALQSISTARLGAEAQVARSPGLWPRLATVLRDVPRRRDQFNGWIPAAAMAVAVAVMVTVSVVQIQREMGDTAWSRPAAEHDLFRQDKRFSPDAPNRPTPVDGLVRYPAQNNNNNW